MTIFVTGGCKNGKSTFALGQALRLGGPRYYLATLLPKDEEERLCVRRHRQARAGLEFVTLEEPFAPSRCAAQQGGRGVFLLDSVTALLANLMFSPEGDFQPHAARQAAGELERFLDAAEHAVVVSDYIYSDGGVYSALSEEFRRGMAQLDRLLARRCDAVVEICGGIPVLHKGGLP